VLVGHGHANKSLSCEGIPVVMGRSNLRAGKSTGGYNLVRIKSDSVYFDTKTIGSGNFNRWHKHALQRIDYSSDTTRYPRPDFSINNSYPYVKELWRYESSSLTVSGAALTGEMAIAGNSSGIITALNVENGNKVWEFHANGPVYCDPGIWNDRVYFSSADSNIYCLENATGKLLWKIKTGAEVVASPAVYNETVFTGASDGIFRAIDGKTGKIRWVLEGIDGYVETRPLIAYNKAVFGAWDGNLYAVDISDGKLKWKWSNGSREELYSPAVCRPVASNGRIFIVAPDRFLSAIDSESGKTIWRSNKFKVRESIGISEDNSRIYARCMTDTVIAVNPSAPDIETVWISDTDYGYDINPTFPVEKNGVIYFGTKNGFVYSLNSADGKVRWIHRSSPSLINNIGIAGPDDLIITTAEGSIIRLKAGQ